MLVLSRRQNESIVIPSLGIEIEIVRIKGNTVRLGVIAPREVKVLRKELLDANQVNEHSRSETTCGSVRPGEVGENSIDSHIGKSVDLLG